MKFLLLTLLVPLMTTTTTYVSRVESTVEFDELGKIAVCESNFQHFDENGEVLKGKITPEDIGKWQINEYFWGETAEKLGINFYTEQGNKEMAEYIYETVGVQAWSASYNPDTKNCYRDENKIM
jgi:hypothetical protein